MRDKKHKRVLLFLCIIALCGGFLYAAWQLWFNPYRGTVRAFGPSEDLQTVLTSAQAVEDLDALTRNLAQRHPACMQGLPKEVQAAYQRERISLQALEEVTVLSLWQSAARVLNRLGDAHTAVGVNNAQGLRLPLSFRWAKDALVCSGGEYDGYAVREAGGIPTAQLYERFLSQFSYELEAWAQHAFATRLGRSEYLAFLGVNPAEEVSFVLENPNDGKRMVLALPLQSTTPEQHESIPNFAYSLDQSAGVGIFTLRQCVFDQEYLTALDNFFTQVEAQRIHSVILDLRGNSGGNSRVAQAFIRYLPVEIYHTYRVEIRFGPILWKNKPQLQTNSPLAPQFLGELYVLTAADTFSSATDFATLISDNQLGTLVGAYPGNMPSSYGDILCFQTPNAGLIYTVSYKNFIRPDSEKSELPLIPDVQTQAENALDAALTLIGDRR